MEYLDYYKRKLDINDYVHMDYQKGICSRRKDCRIYATKSKSI